MASGLVVCNAGALRERIVVERRGVLKPRKGDGGVTGAEWQAYSGRLSARIRPLRGGEEVLAGRLASKRQVEITLRGSALVRGIVQDDRIVGDQPGSVYAGQLFDIRDIQNPDERGAWFVFLCESGVASG